MGSGAHSFADHTGELAIHLRGDTLGELFTEAGRALAEVMSGREPKGDGAYERVTLQAPDREALLVAWLDELVFLAERDKKIFGDLRIERIADRELVASVRGEPTSELKTHVKAATFHGLKIVDGPDGVSATVILDV
jgi:SHS2 domain-containing protein